MTKTTWRSNPKNPCPICNDQDGSCKGIESGLILCFKGVQHRDKAPDGYRFVKEADGGMGGIFAPITLKSDQKSRAYTYSTEDGMPYMQVSRYYKGGNKHFAQSHWDGSKWVKGLPPGFDRIPFQLERLAKTDLVLVFEGEKDCITANNNGLELHLNAVATTNPQGAGKWPSGWGERYFAGKTMVIFPDNDAPGRDHACQVLKDCKNHADKVVLIPLPGLPDRGDLTDYLDLGGTVREVAEMIKAALDDPDKHGIDQLSGIDDDSPSDPPPQTEEKAAVQPPQPPPLARRFEAVKLVVDGGLRLNLLTKEIELNGESLEHDEMILKLACKYCVNVPDNHAKKIFVSLAKQNAYHPIVDYLNEVASEHGDDTTILDDLALKYLGTDNPLHQTFLRKWAISAVRRIFEPGCKVDNVLILHGKQWVGKSTFFETLASKHWFDDTMGSIADKDERLKMHMVWICEWAELEQIFKRKDISAVKSFLTTKDDLIRPPYGEKTERMPRRGVIVGTTNESELLGDVTGNRRFWIVTVEQPIDTNLLTQERDRIWAAAVAAYRAGESHYLTQDEFVLSEEQNAEFAFSDPWESLVSDYVSLLPRVTTVELLRDCLKLPVEKLDRAGQMRVANIMKRLGWTQKVTTILGKATRVWLNQLIYSQE
jgi:predicted P-loop ATPase